MVVVILMFAFLLWMCIMIVMVTPSA